MAVFVLLTVGMLADRGSAENVYELPLDNMPKKQSPTGYIPHEPIYINGNAQFNSTNGVVSGNGSISNPFVIGNWDINASNNVGISIVNTSDFFIIKNCTIQNGGKNPQYMSFEGLLLLNVTCGKIENNTIIYNGDGILIHSSSKIIITNNSFSGNYMHGIKIFNSTNKLYRCRII